MVIERTANKDGIACQPLSPGGNILTEETPTRIGLAKTIKQVGTKGLPLREKNSFSKSMRRLLFLLPE